MMYQKSVPIARTRPTKLRTPKVATKLAKPVKVTFILSESSWCLKSNSSFLATLSVFLSLSAAHLEAPRRMLCCLSIDSYCRVIVQQEGSVVHFQMRALALSLIDYELWHR